MSRYQNNHTAARLRVLLKSPIFIVLVLSVGFGVGFTIFHYRAHLLWHFGAGRAGLDDIQPIPDYPMPDTPIPEDWIRCRVGCVEFRLPPELARSGVAHPKVSVDGFLIEFQHNSRTVVVDLLQEEFQSGDVLSAADALSPSPYPQPFTMPRLRLAVYRAASNDFSWSMTPEELRWHVFCLSTGRLMRLISEGHVETAFTKELDILVQFGNTRAAVEWQFHRTPCGGHMLFFGEENVDQEWIRAVGRSLKPSNHVPSEDSKILAFPDEQVDAASAIDGY